MGEMMSSRLVTLWLGSLKVREYSEDLGGDGRIILKWVPWN
jgi:hypothetical protein